MITTSYSTPPDYYLKHFDKPRQIVSVPQNLKIQMNAQALYKIIDMNRPSTPNGSFVGTAELQIHVPFYGAPPSG